MPFSLIRYARHAKDPGRSRGLCSSPFSGARARRTGWSVPRPGSGLAETSRARKALVALAIVFMVLALTSCGERAEQDSSDRPAPPEGVQSFKVSERPYHVEKDVSYPQTPPVGGDHSPDYQNCGFYEAPIEDELAVHTMEHGAVWITYRSDLSRGQVKTLRELARGQNYVLVSPFDGLTAPVVASAWGKQLRLDGADDPRLEQFVNAFQEGPQAPESGWGIPCTDGKGNP